MGLMIENGFDAFTPDPFRAVEFYQKAHNNKNTDATFNLGLLYLKTPEFETTPEDALELIQKAAMTGNKRAQEHLINLGLINNKAEFISSNPKKEEILESEGELEEEESESEESNTI
jgi:TPR repeat protein